MRAGPFGVAAFMTLGVASAALAQSADTTLAQEGIFNRPFITSSGGTSIGGYLEGNTNWFVEDGVGEGFSMELRRFNIFLFASVSPRVRFLSELEFEHGTEEIALETALIDVRLHPALVFRAGILLPPVGYFNQNHDGPRWDFVERPLVSTEIIPSTLSEVGAGLYGKAALGSSVVSYDVYATNGLGNGIVNNAEGRTYIPAGKSEEQFAEDNNGTPSLSARVAVRRPAIGELGLSWYGGAYNSFQREGEAVDASRRVDLVALDAGVRLGPVAFRGEAVMARVQLPESLGEVFGERQWGGHLDAVVPIWRPKLAGYRDAVVALGGRVEHVDFNRGRFASTGRPIGDSVTGVVAGLSFRPTDETVFRANYRFDWSRDLVGNDRTRAAGLQLGFATYF